MASRRGFPAVPFHSVSFLIVHAVVVHRQAQWGARSQLKIKKRRKLLKDSAAADWTDGSSLNAAAQLAVVQEAMLTCAQQPDKVNPVDAMLDTFMSTVPALIGLLSSVR